MLNSQTRIGGPLVEPEFHSKTAIQAYGISVPNKLYPVVGGVSESSIVITHAPELSRQLVEFQDTVIQAALNGMGDEWAAVVNQRIRERLESRPIRIHGGARNRQHHVGDTLEMIQAGEELRIQSLLRYAANRLAEAWVPTAGCSAEDEEVTQLIAEFPVGMPTYFVNMAPPIRGIRLGLGADLRDNFAADPVHSYRRVMRASRVKSFIGPIQPATERRL